MHKWLYTAESVHYIMWHNLDARIIYALSKPFKQKE